MQTQSFSAMTIHVAKVVLLGDMAVGKTSIVIQISRGKFEPNISSTVGVSYLTTTVNTSRGQIELRIWDTAGQEAFRNVIPAYLRGSDACVLVASVTDAKSIDNLAEWYDFVQQHHQEYKRIVVAFNKIDLDNDSPAIDRGRDWCEAQGLTWFETSAKQSETLKPLVQRLAEDLYETSKIEPSTILESPIKHNNSCC